ncbi:MAG TPA: DUF1631 family protein [Burkholderiaceae bacterium]|nr:DUF1631 family protein [Burkholderiaceae bacterium]
MSSDPDNPIPGLAPPGQAPSRRPAARRVLKRCWEPIRLAIEPYLPDLPVVALGTIAKTGEEEEARAAKLVIANARNFQQQFPIVLEGEIRAAIAKFVTDKAAEQKRGPMTLVEYDAVEDTTAMERAASRLRNAVEDEYASVRLRLANLVCELEVRDAETPFRPYVFVHAIFVTLDRIGLKRNQLATIVRSFDAALIGPVAAVYAAIDHHLAGQGISAEFARQVARNSATPRNGLAGGVTENALNGPATLPKLTAEQMLTALYQHMHLAPGAVPALPPIDAARTAPAAARSPTLQVRPPTVSGRPPTLTGMAPFAAEAKTVNVDVNLINAINDAQRLGALALAAMQQGKAVPAAQPANTQIRGELAERAVKQLDKLTIEIVGLLFDRIQQDKLVPDAIKDLLQRLQFPLLKVAVVDADLFVSADQSARRLLDRIAATSIGWTPDGEQNERYLQAVTKAVMTVLATRDDAAGAFERALEGFEQFLEDETARDDDPVARARRALAEAEQREMMATNAAGKIRSAFEGVQIESYLREFLLDVWGRVLVAATMRESHDPSIARRYLAVVPELVWSVQPKIHPDDRRRLVGTIPPVLTALREGLTLINWPKPKMQEFFSRLMQSHALAVRALELAQGAAPPAGVEASTLRIKLDGVRFCADEVPDSQVEGIDVSDDVVKQVIADCNVDVEHMAAPAEPAAGSDEVKLNRTIAGWQRGDWFEMRVGDRAERLQLRWISPRRTLFLFAPAAAQAGAATRSLTPAALRAFLRNGQLSAVAAAPLFERAVREVMAGLQHATGTNELAYAF